ncbi:MAG: lysophospholipid acyltransferase family protein [Opitutaceae bacterium]|jgi:1-acyl-sn-glycerol-3-phosphate acyltransferase
MSVSPTELEMEPLYGLSHAIIRIVYEIFFRGEIAGLENLPAGGGYIVASNHASLFDPPMVGLYIPQQVVFFARKTLWKKGFASWWLDGVGTIPVDRDGGTDVAAIKRVLQTLRRGRVVILFPEGTRSRDGRLQPPRPGIGLIACRTGMPVVPARVFGSFDAFGRDGRLHFGSPISIRYGRPLKPEEYDRPEDGRERYARAAERIMAAIERIEPPSRPVI